MMCPVSISLFVSGANEQDKILEGRVPGGVAVLIPAWICNHIDYKVWDEINYPFLNFNGASVEV